MNAFRNLCINLCISGVLFCAFIGVRSSLPVSVSSDNLSLDPQASTLSRLVVRAAIPMARTQIHDYIVFKTADVQLGDKQISLVALPGTNWVRYQ